MVRISPVKGAGVFLADEEDLQFFIAELPKGGWGVTCEECRNAGKEPHVWTFTAFPLVLIGMREHRREHFGLAPGVPT
jgi:hypothetical protein